MRNESMLTRAPFQSIIERYTPTMLEVVAPASPDEIARLERVAGGLPEAYSQFLAWMGNRCPFLDGDELAYAPRDLFELVYDDPDLGVPDGFLCIGVDRSGGSVDVYLRRSDGLVARAGYHEHLSEADMLFENISLDSYLVAAYVRRTLAPSHPFHFAAAFQGTPEQTADIWVRVDEACSHFEITHPLQFPDMRLYGGTDFVIGIQQRPRSTVVDLHFGAIDRTVFEPWYDLVFARWHLIRMPE
jgi:hypothetical protein